jgi:mannose-6-phosphate isomerase-like protein (cupin superfamily)
MNKLVSLSLATFLSCVPMVIVAQAPTSPDNPLASSRVFDYDRMKTRTMPNGAESRIVFNGTLASGESVGAHESIQPAGATPPQPHKIQHSEFLVVVEGTLEFNHDGKQERAGPGSIIYVALGTNHFVKNVGDGPAKYVVIQVGGDTKK